MRSGEWGPEIAARPGWWRALGAGLAGTATVTVLNEVGRRVIPGAPRAEVLGKRGIRAIARRMGKRPDEQTLYRSALAGEVISNTLYYGLAALATRRPLRAGVALGAAAGAGAVYLPPRLGLGRAPTRRTARTAGLSFGWYLAAGVVAGMVARRMRPMAPSWSY
jgi:hypothetical protein